MTITSQGIARNHSRLSPPENSDGIPATMCRHCGLDGQHGDRDACISALRSELALAQFRIKGSGRSRSAARTDAGISATEARGQRHALTR
jgi:hypothetical protein